MASTNPILLTKTTRFAPTHLRGHSRSPSRSPIRKSQFLARELDPLLNNLSPDSTLRALQSTSAVSDDQTGQDALTQSIADATPAERELGIRAAVAAQKLRQWRQEVEQWTWPARRERARGMGFLPPKRNSIPSDQSPRSRYLGFLPSHLVYEYEERIENIRDGIEALDLEEIKDHIFSAHVSRTNGPIQDSPGRPHSPTYGRMRDFTALVTATVVQALPDMANLNMLLDTWEVRLSVLRQIPQIEDSFKTTQDGIQTAVGVVRAADTGPLVTLDEFETVKKLLGDKVFALGSQIDKLLDALESQEDTLPQEWLDDLETIENEYAAWAVEAEHVAIQNGLSAQTTPPGSDKHIPTVQFAPSSAHQVHEYERDVPDGTEGLAELPAVRTPLAELPAGNPAKEYPFLSQEPPSPPIYRKSSLQVKTSHKRDVSEVSMAGSAFSGISDLSEAEIVDARRTQLLVSPKISVIENPFRTSRDELVWYDNNLDTNIRPPMIQRASTASIEVIQKDQVRQLNLNRSHSHELLSTITQSPPSTPSKALRQLTGADDSSIRSDQHGIRPATSPAASPAPKRIESFSASRQPPPEMVIEPLRIKSREVDGANDVLPDIPRKSSKRLSFVQSTESIPLEVSQEIPDTDHAVETAGTDSVHSIVTAWPGQRPESRLKDESLEEKIKDILTTMPTKIRLTSQTDAENDPHLTVMPISRSSTPAPSLTLSPVKNDRSNRKAAPGDIRLFHLTRAGQTRDTPPVKLFVRAVGEHGERVMVRVGGGWADLGEYLREYSLHHGHRNLADGKLEVANFPGNQNIRESTPVTALPTTRVDPASRPLKPNDSNSRRRSFGFGSLSGLGLGKTRKNSRSKSIEANELRRSSTPPPVPHVPESFASHSGNAYARGSHSAAKNNISTDKRAVSTPVNLRHSLNHALPSGINVISPANSSNKYTPLGAAGPKTQGRRVVSTSTVPGSENEAWVEGMVGRARAVSGNTTTVVTTPTVTTTTTTTVYSRSKPTNWQVSAPVSISMSNSHLNLLSPLTPMVQRPATPVSTNSSTGSRSKARMSFGDVSGIKRVFLRRKSSNNSNAQKVVRT